MEKKKKLIILGVIILILAISGLTYAILTWTSSKINIGLTSGCFTIDYTKGQDISGNLKLMDWGEIYSDSDNTFMIKEGMGLSYVNIGIKSTCTIEGYGSLYLNVTTLSDAFKEDGDSYEALRYAVLSNTSNLSSDNINTQNLNGQSFEMINEGPITDTGTITLLTKQLSNTEIYKYLVVIYADNDFAGNSITSATFNGNISADAEQSVSTPDYCFNITNKDDENMTAIISNNGYNCYEGNSNGYETITDVVIPSKIDGYTITSIGYLYSVQCYSGGQCPMNKKGLTSVIIPNTIKEIGGYAFSENNLSYVKIPDSVTTIGVQAFYGNWLSDVTLSDSVTTIKDAAFSYNQLTNIKIPDSVTKIDSNTFAGNNLTSVTIPDSVITIGDSAFSYNNLNYVLINSSSKLTTIGQSTFQSSNKTTISNGKTYVDNPNLKIIYNNSGKAFDWNYAVNGISGTAFVTGTTNTVGSAYNAVTVTTGQPGDS